MTHCDSVTMRGWPMEKKQKKELAKAAGSAGAGAAVGPGCSAGQTGPFVC